MAYVLALYYRFYYSVPKQYLNNYKSNIVIILLIYSLVFTTFGIYKSLWVYYWFVRTNGGKYYKDFYENNYIGICWNEITNLNEIRKSDKDQLRELIKTTYPDEERPGAIATNISRFVKEMEIGDYVLVPSEGSDVISL
jgi:hypothetical protein